MKKIALVLASLSVLACADGYDVYKKHCAACHIEMTTHAYVVKHLDEMKAPPMVEVSNHLKENIVIKSDDEDVHRHLFVLYVKDYIINPTLQKSLCRPGALDRFGVMPPLKGRVNETEAQEVAEWLYERYEGVKFE